MLRVQLLRFDHPVAATNPEATAQLRITVKDSDPKKVGRRFSGAVLELALGGYAGFHTTTPPTSESAYGVYWPALVPVSEVRHAVVLPDGGLVSISPTPTGPRRWDPMRAEAVPAEARPADAVVVDPAPVGHGVESVRVPLGTVCGARSGDKGGNANVGLWARDDADWQWLREALTIDAFRALLPEADTLDVRRFELPNLRALNFVVVGLLGEGVASSTRPDPQAKGLGEYLRSRMIDLPTTLLS